MIMRLRSAVLFLCVAAVVPRVSANLCQPVRDTFAGAQAQRDLTFYEEIFPLVDYQGNRNWNAIVLECNRQRDTKGREVEKSTGTGLENDGKATLRTANLRPKVIRGHYNFFGQIALQLKYVYILSRTNGFWTMIIPYKPEINELVEDRVDFFIGTRDIHPKTGAVTDVTESGHAWILYDQSQVVSSGGVLALKPGALPIAQTLCTTSTFFPGKEDKYDGQNDAKAHKRDPENKHISLGKIQHGFRSDDFLREGCRVHEDRDLFHVDASGKVVKVKPQDFVLDNFVRQAEEYWSIPKVFELKLLMKGRNDSRFPQSTRDLLKDDDHLTVRFATKFLPYHGNQMYKSNLIQFNNFSTMTTDGTYWHEVGHAFGLDDEYGGEGKDDPKKNGCEAERYAIFEPLTYQMCNAGATDKWSIYHYIAVSRYITKQNECDANGDCLSSEYCDKGTISIGRNQCVAKKADHEPCDLVGGGDQCIGGSCKFSRCYTPQSVSMGGTCYNDDACREGKCTAIDGAKGTCVCKNDTDCDSDQWCDGGLDAKKNVCRDKLAKGESCGKAGSVGNDHKCKSDKCSGFPNYKCK